MAARRHADTPTRRGHAFVDHRRARMELSPKGILFARGRLNSPYAMRVRHYVDFDSLHRADNGRHERNAPINIPRLAATIASAALGMSDPCTSEAPSPRGIESSLFTTQRLGAVTEGPATTTGGPYAHRAQDTQGHGLGS
jgi:hypothetical protein